MSKDTQKTLRLNPGDNVVVALEDLDTGNTIDGGVACLDFIPSGHKVAMEDIEQSRPIYKYGQIIGFASQRIQPGDHVHTHNMGMKEFKREYAIGSESRPTNYIPETEQATFNGIRREDGKVGTRNYIGVLATANCSTSVSYFIADHFTDALLAEYPNVDGVVALGHGSGCAMVPGAEGFQYLQQALAGYANHPNFVGVVLVGLGCEVNEVDCLMENMNLNKDFSLRSVNVQDVGGTKKTVSKGIEAIKAMLPKANRIERCAVSAGHIMLGLECGGSDAYSGISSNPVLGRAVDLLIKNGGTAILSETPEIYGAEHLLVRRASNRLVGEKLLERIQWWKAYTSRHGAVIDNNPSPGNKAGGLTTILEKSLGASAKAGSSDLIEVYGYAESVNTKGLVFMDTPGYDPVSITGMIAGGANVICFTTGRGSVCGFKPVPTLKLASNTATYRRMREDMDLNCGSIIDGENNLDEMGESLFRLILETASGKKTRSETLGFGDNEFVPWHIGVVM